MSNSEHNRSSGDSTARSARAAAESATAKAALATGAAKTRRKATATAAARQPAGTRRARAKPRSGANGAKAAAARGQLQPLIAETAYFIAEREGFPAGRELEHWLQAELEVLEGLEPD